MNCVSIANHTVYTSVHFAFVDAHIVSKQTSTSLNCSVYIDVIDVLMRCIFITRRVHCSRDPRPIPRPSIQNQLGADAELDESTPHRVGVGSGLVVLALHRTLYERLQRRPDDRASLLAAAPDARLAVADAFELLILLLLLHRHLLRK